MSKSLLRVLKPQIKKRELKFVFDVNDQRITSGYSFNFDVDNKYQLDDPILLDFALHAALAYCPMLFRLEYFDEIEVEGSLTDEEVNFYEDLIYFGLAELRYTCGIEIKKRTKLITESSKKEFLKVNDEDAEDKALLFVGGGKDGIVAGQILHEVGQAFDVFILNPLKFRAAQSNKWPNTNIFSASRLTRTGLDGLSTKNNGHNPLNAELAALAQFVALATGHKYSVAANEFSANFPNLTVEGIDINHQHTKSHEFEKRVQELYERYENSPYYFSIVRPLYEFQIMKIFSKFPHLQTGFSSCNQKSDLGGWCLSCAKCAYIALTLWAINPEQARKLWGKNIFSSPQMHQQLIALIDDSPKPFDCVGTLEESRLAVHLAKQNNAFAGSSSKQQSEITRWIADFDYEVVAKTMSDVGREDSFPDEMASQIRTKIDQLVN